MTREEFIPPTTNATYPRHDTPVRAPSIPWDPSVRESLFGDVEREMTEEENEDNFDHGSPLQEEFYLVQPVEPAPGELVLPSIEGPDGYAPRSSPMEEESHSWTDSHLTARNFYGFFAASRISIDYYKCDFSLSRVGAESTLQNCTLDNSGNGPMKCLLPLSKRDEDFLTLRNVHISNSKLTAATISDSSIALGSTLNSCKLSNCTITNCRLESCEIDNCNLIGCTLAWLDEEPEKKLNYVLNSTISNSTLDHVYVTSTRLEACYLRRGCNATYSVFEGECEFTELLDIRNCLPGFEGWHYLFLEDEARAKVEPHISSPIVPMWLQRGSESTTD